MGAILDDSDLDVVRSLIKAEAEHVSDELLTSFPYLDFVEAMVKQGITDWATIMTTGGDDATFLKTGVAALLAMFVCDDRLRSSPSYTASFSIGGYQENRGAGGWNQEQWDVVVMKLRRRAKMALGLISTRTWNRPDIFVVSGPTRAETTVPTTFEQWLERVQPRFIDWVEEGEEDDDYI